VGQEQNTLLKSQNPGNVGKKRKKKRDRIAHPQKFSKKPSFDFRNREWYAAAEKANAYQEKYGNFGRNKGILQENRYGVFTAANLSFWFFGNLRS